MSGGIGGEGYQSSQSGGGRKWRALAQRGGGDQSSQSGGVGTERSLLASRSPLSEVIGQDAVQHHAIVVGLDDGADFGHEIVRGGDPDDVRYLITRAISDHKSQHCR